jgi:hypothetical protein
MESLNVLHVPNQEMIDFSIDNGMIKFTHDFKYNRISGLLSLSLTANISDQLDTRINVLDLLDFLGFEMNKDYPLERKIENISFNKVEHVLLDQLELLRDIFDALLKVEGHDVNRMISYILMQQWRYVPDKLELYL